MMERTTRRARPSLEGLEGRNLLSGTTNPSVHALATAPATNAATITVSTPTQFNYTTGNGAKVRVSLGGPGSLTGTALDANGNLNLVFADTSIFTSITGTVRGGSGQANLGSIRNAGVPLTSTTGVGGSLMGRISLKQFNLVSGGNINLLAGVNELALNSVSANSQLHLRDTPLNTTLGISTSVDPITRAGLGYVGNQPYRTNVTGTNILGLTTTTGLTGVFNAGTTDPFIYGFGGAAPGAISGAIPIIPTIGNGQNFRGTPGLTQGQVSFGRNLAYAFGATAANANAIRLASVGGTFTPGSNLVEPRDLSLAGNEHIPPPGVLLNINQINGNTTSTATPPLGSANIFGFDPATNRLIRFNTNTGAVVSSIVVPGPTATNGQGGVALARNGTELVALVGVGSTVQAYDALSGVFVGQFASARTISGIATVNGQTILLDARDPANEAVAVIDVPGSLAVGQTVSVGGFSTPARGFVFGGGVTGVPGTSNVYALGTAVFDTATPNQTQVGVIALTPTAGGTLTEASRTVLNNNGVNVPGTNGVINGSNSRALGSIGSTLALDIGLINGQNVLSLVNPTTLASQGSLSLNYPNLLSDLSESYHPEIAGTALIDVQGNIQALKVKSANGLVLDSAGNLNLLQVGRLTNSSVVGLPISHVKIGTRNNVEIITNSRLIGNRNGVTVVPALRPIGPLSLPT